MEPLIIVKDFINSQKFIKNLLSLNLKGKYDVFQLVHDRGRVFFEGPKKEWRCGVHGAGIFCKNKLTGEEIDFDFRDNGDVGGFSPWFISLFVENRIKIGIYDKKGYQKFTDNNFWRDFFKEMYSKKEVKYEEYSRLYYFQDE
ncbi:MAG: hypothetical protein ACI9P5_004859 [Saprospiraceae bacterium]|jgi:hypothetical protein